MSNQDQGGEDKKPTSVILEKIEWFSKLIDEKIVSMDCRVRGVEKIESNFKMLFWMIFIMGPVGGAFLYWDLYSKVSSEVELVIKEKAHEIAKDNIEEEIMKLMENKDFVRKALDDVVVERLVNNQVFNELIQEKFSKIDSDDKLLLLKYPNLEVQDESSLLSFFKDYLKVKPDGGYFRIYPFYKKNGFYFTVNINRKTKHEYDFSVFLAGTNLLDEVVRRNIMLKTGRDFLKIDGRLRLPKFTDNSYSENLTVNQVAEKLKLVFTDYLLIPLPHQVKIDI